MSRWNCPHCRGPIGPTPDLAGQSVACPYCLTPISVPRILIRKQSNWNAKWFVIVLLLLTAGLSSAFIVYDVPLAEAVGRMSSGLRLASNTFDPPRVTTGPELDQPKIFQDACAARSRVASQNECFLGRPTETIQCDEKQPQRYRNEIGVRKPEDQLAAAQRPSQHATVGEPGRLPELPPSNWSETGEHTVRRTSTDSFSTDNSVKIYLGNPSQVDPEMTRDLTATTNANDEKKSESTKTADGSNDEEGSGEASEPSAVDVAEVSLASFMPSGLGVSRDEVIHTIQEYFDVEFDLATDTNGGEEEVTGLIEDTKITLRGGAENIRSVTVHGGFDGENMAITLAAIISRILPEWKIEDAGEWFSKAVQRCDKETFVSTFRDNVEVTMTTSRAAGNFWIFLQPDRG